MSVPLSVFLSEEIVIYITTTTCYFYTFFWYYTKQMTYNVFISEHELYRQADFNTFVQSQARTFTSFPVFMLSVASYLPDRHESGIHFLIKLSAKKGKSCQSPVVCSGRRSIAEKLVATSQEKSWRRSNKHNPEYRNCFIQR